MTAVMLPCFFGGAAASLPPQDKQEERNIGADIMYVKRVLPNGVRIISERLDNVRTVSVGIWVGNGSRYEPAELNGISHFIEHMIFKGTEKRSARHIAIAIDALGGQANAFTDKECTCYYMKVLDSRTPDRHCPARGYVPRVALRAGGHRAERGVVLEEIDMYEDSPEDVAIDKLFEKCYDGSLARPPHPRHGGDARAHHDRDHAQIHARVLPPGGHGHRGLRPFHGRGS